MRYVFIAAALVLLLVSPAFAVEDFSDPCYSAVLNSVQIGFGVVPGDVPVNGSMVVENTCETTTIEWEDPVALDFGDLQDGEVVITATSVYVDSDLRPDLDKPAMLTFVGLPFAVEPGVLKDGLVCLDCLTDWDPSTRTMQVNVTGFSNYSLSGRQDFEVHSDPDPELRGKVYQVVDLGDAYRNRSMTCNVMIFAENPVQQLVLVQTNPEREVQARLWGSPDSNQPESLGYFPVVNGVANVYFRNDLLTRYAEFSYVVKCQDETEQLIYEETIHTEGTPLARSFTGFTMWTIDGTNMLFIILYLVVGVLLIWLFAKYARSVRLK